MEHVPLREGFPGRTELDRIETSSIAHTHLSLFFAIKRPLFTLFSQFIILATLLTQKFTCRILMVCFPSFILEFVHIHLQFLWFQLSRIFILKTDQLNLKFEYIWMNSLGKVLPTL